MPFSSSRPLVVATRQPPIFVVRLVQCVLGLACCGVGLALIFHSELGRSPWDVLHEGISRHTGIEIGVVIIVVGFMVLALWIPLRERPGLGTVLNAILIGTVLQLVLPLLPATDRLAPRSASLAAGILVMGAGSAIYIRAGLGTGPRDGLMTGLARISPLSIRLARTLVEAVALAIGVLLGGRIGIGTLAFAVTIGPVVQGALKLTDRLLGTGPPPVAPSTNVVVSSDSARA